MEHLLWIRWLLETDNRVAKIQLMSHVISGKTSQDMNSNFLILSSQTRFTEHFLSKISKVTTMIAKVAEIRNVRILQFLELK